MKIDIKPGTEGLITVPGVLRLAEEAAKPREGIPVYLCKLLASSPGRGCWDSETTTRARRWKTCQGSRLSEDMAQELHTSLSCVYSRGQERTSLAGSATDLRQPKGRPQPSELPGLRPSWGHKFASPQSSRPLESSK